MAEVPKIVGKRLRAARPVTGHPDADVLTAFAERTLRASERDFVLEHLARCDDCREVVALALPAVEDVQTVVSPVRSGWFTAPMLRWGAIAAAVLVVATVAIRRNQTQQRATDMPTILLRQYSTPQKELAQSRDQDARLRADESRLAPPAAQAESADRATDLKDAPKAGDKGAFMTYKSQSPAAGVVGGAIGSINAPAKKDSSPVNSYSRANASPGPVLDVDKVAAAPAPAAPAAAARIPAEKQAALAGARADAAANAGELQANLETKTQSLPMARRNEQPQPSQGDGRLTEKEEDRLADEQAKPEAAEGFTAAKVPMLPTPAPRWMVKGGAVQRSLDAGRTWQEINVAAMTVADVQSAYALSKTSEVAITTKAAKKKANAAPVFSAVAALMLEVWAGGTAGSLYHSTDGGSSWTRVVASDSGETLTSDISGIEVADAQHVKIVSSNVWTTADGGKTWHKQ